MHRRDSGRSPVVGGREATHSLRNVRRRMARDVRTAVEAGVMSAGAQGDRGSGAPAAGRLVAMLRRKPLTGRRAAVIIASFTVLVTFAGGLVRGSRIGRTSTAWARGCGGRCRRSPRSVRRCRAEQRHRPRDRCVRDDPRHRIPHGDHCRSDRELIEAARRRQPPAPDREQLSDFMREVTSRLSAIEARLDERGPRADK